MVWLWLLFPLLVLVAACALWRATGQLAAERRALQSDVDALSPVGGAARSVPVAGSVSTTSRNQRTRPGPVFSGQVRWW